MRSVGDVTDTMHAFGTSVDGRLSIVAAALLVSHFDESEGIVGLEGGHRSLRVCARLQAARAL